MQYYVSGDNETKADARDIPESAWEAAKVSFPRSRYSGEAVGRGVRIVDRDDPRTVAQAAAWDIWVEERDERGEAWPVTIVVIDEVGKEHEFAIDLQPAAPMEKPYPDYAVARMYPDYSVDYRLMQDGVVLLQGEEDAVREIHRNLIGKHLEPEVHRKYCSEMSRSQGWENLNIEHLSVAKGKRRRSDER